MFQWSKPISAAYRGSTIDSNQSAQGHNQRPSIYNAWRQCCRSNVGFV